MKKIYTWMLMGIALSSCNKFDEDINQNPNLPSQASGTQLIASAELSLRSLSSSPAGEFMGQYLAETQYVGESLYPEGGTSFYPLFQEPLMDLETVLNTKELSASGGPVENQMAVAKILKAYYFWHITDRWGDVPYTEALKGVANLTPVYDTQQSIYYALFDLLEEASNQIVAGNITNDIIFGGDMAKWKKFANTIRLLMALRLSKIDPAKGSEEFNQALSAGIMEGNADNFLFKNLADANNQNYWYGQIVGQNRQWWALTETLVGYMKPDDDPRLPIFGSRASASGEYVGLKFGTTDANLLGTTEYSLLGPAIYAQDAPVYLVTYAQALFAKAEAAKLGWISGGDVVAKESYEQAITNSIAQWTGSTDGVGDFINKPEVRYQSATAMRQIAVQRWIHLFMHGYEAWAEWRRTGFPDNLVSPQGKPVPRRQSYPANEAFNNATHYREAVDRQFGGTDDLSGRVWWDKP